MELCLKLGHCFFWIDSPVQTQACRNFKSDAYKFQRPGLNLAINPENGEPTKAPPF
jgi:hypothetical protein